MATGAHLPTLRDPDLLIYFREEGGGLIMGGYERHSAPWSLDEHLLDAIPQDFNGRLLEEDWPRFEEIAVNSRKRVPVMDEITVTRLINGPEAFTPDNEFCLGESEVRGFFVAAGFCAHGLAGAGGIGKVMAEWILEGEPSIDVWEMDIRRFGAHFRSPSYTLKRTRGGLRDLLRHPLPRPRAPRGPAAAHLQRLPLARRASTPPSARSPAGSASTGTSPTPPPATSRCARAAGRACTGRPRSAPSIAPRASAPGCSTSPPSPSSRSPGPAPPSSSQRLCDNDVAREVGAITYTQMLNRRGGIECDFTVTRVEEELFSIVTGTAFGNHDLSWIRRHAPHDGSVRCTDVTARWACFALWGPRARDILAPLTDDPLDFPYMHMRELAVGDVPVRALRVTFVGELGWELYCPTEYGAGLWRTLWQAGREHGLTAGGYRAIDSLRLEKGYRVWAADITPDETPYEAGLGFCVRKQGGFIGAPALGLGAGGEKHPHPAPPHKRLRCLVLEDPRSVALGNEPVRIGGEIAGRVTSGGYGYTVERSIAYAYLPAELEVGTAVEVDIFGQLGPRRRHARAAVRSKGRAHQGCECACDACAVGLRSARLSGRAGARSRIVRVLTCRRSSMCSSSPESSSRQPGSASMRSLASTTSGRADPASVCTRVPRLLSCISGSPGSRSSTYSGCVCG